MTDPARPYHHGNLVEALLAAAVALIEENGVEALSVRAVAKRAGVSAGAPFRHFENKAALLTAVAEQAMERLTESVLEVLAAARPCPALEALAAIGTGYLSWARDNPTHFRIISSRERIDFHGSARLVAQNEALRQIMLAEVLRAQAEGSLRPGLTPEDVMLSARAFVYGLARMWVDGHFPEWQERRPPPEAMQAALDLFLSGISARPGQAPWSKA